MSHEREEGLTRRQAIAVGLAGAATIATLPGALGSDAEPSADGTPRPSAPGRLPVVFLPHGGGPWPFVDVGMSKPEHEELAGYLLVDSSNLSRTAASLVTVGLVAREEDERDRRSVALAITERGRKAHERIARRRREQLRTVLAPMEPERRELLAELLDEYIDLVELTKDDGPPA